MTPRALRFCLLPIVLPLAAAPLARAEPSAPLPDPTAPPVAPPAATDTRAEPTSVPADAAPPPEPAEAPVAAEGPAQVPEAPAEQAVVEPPAAAPEGPEWEQETLLGMGPIEHGAYGGLNVRYSRLNGDSALFVGGRGGWLLNHHLLIGFAGAGQTLEVAAPEELLAETPAARNLEFGYGGALFGYHLAPARIVHPVVYLLVGAGGLATSDREGMMAGDNDSRRHWANGVFVLEPELAVEANLAPFMRAQLSLSYRSVWGVGIPGLSNGDVSAFAGGLALAFGRF